MFSVLIGATNRFAGQAEPASLQASQPVFSSNVVIFANLLSEK